MIETTYVLSTTRRKQTVLASALVQNIKSIKLSFVFSIMSLLYIFIMFLTTYFQLLYWYNCPRYLWLRNKVYQEPEVKLKIQQYQKLFAELSKRTGTNITTPEDVFYLDNLFQALVRKLRTNMSITCTYNTLFLN